MDTREVYSAKAVALRHIEAGSNKIDYLGLGFFPANKKAGLDLKWIVTSTGLPVALMPSAFDTVSAIRSREGFKVNETEMPFFKESMLLKEQDEQDIMRIQDSADPFAQDVINRIYNDSETLVAGANVVPERMRMQLFANANGNPSISIEAGGVKYAYNYDPNNTYKENNFLDLTEGADASTNMWSNITDSDPIADVEAGLDAVEASTGTRPSIMLISKQTMNYLKANAKVRSYILAQNHTANVLINDVKVKELFSMELGVNIIVYTKMFKDEAGLAQKFYPDGFATLLPEGALGNTWYGMTPEERTGVKNPCADVSLVDTGVAVSVTISEDPVQTKTTVSEIVLPSYERMMETFMIKAYTVA